MLQRISCAACGSNKFDRDAEGNLICSFCGTKFSSPREKVMCPACGTENPPEARRCMQCGLALGKACPTCNHVNPPGLDHCEKCAAPLDVLEAVISRARTQGRQIGYSKDQLVQSKQEDDSFMQAQRARLVEEERQRIARLAAQRQQAIKQQRLVIIIGLLFVGLLVAAGVALIVLTSGPPGG